MIHQELSLSRSMTVADNIFQGRMLTNRLGFIDRPAGWWRRAGSTWPPWAWWTSIRARS